jgi:hypothetical protein
MSLHPLSVFWRAYDVEVRWDVNGTPFAIRIWIAELQSFVWRTFTRETGPINRCSPTPAVGTEGETPYGQGPSNQQFE